MGRRMQAGSQLTLLPQMDHLRLQDPCNPTPRSQYGHSPKPEEKSDASHIRYMPEWSGSSKPEQGAVLGHLKPTLGHRSPSRGAVLGNLKPTTDSSKPKLGASLQ